MISIQAASNRPFYLDKLVLIFAALTYLFVFFLFEAP